MTTIDPARPAYRDGYQCGQASFKHGHPYQPGPHATVAEKHFATGYGDGWSTAQDAAEAAHRADAKRAAAGDGYLPSQCPLGLHDNLHPGPDGECEDCELQGLA